MKLRKILFKSQLFSWFQITLEHILKNEIQSSLMCHPRMDFCSMCLQEGEFKLTQSHMEMNVLFRCGAIYTVCICLI